MEYKNSRLEEFENWLIGKKVAVIGLGVSNLPLLDYLYEKKAIVTVLDEREKENFSDDVINKIERYKFDTAFGKEHLSKLKGFDLIFRSPICLPTKPELQAEKSRGAIITTEIELLIKLAPCKIIGVTGSDGKTTTTTVIHKILNGAGYKAWLGGNIGIPLFTKIKEIMPDDVVVLELSSFQLMGMEKSPDISVMTNVTPNHLNVHKDYEEYIDSKKNIFRYQSENGKLILNLDNDITKSCKSEANGKVVYFSSKEKLQDGYIVDNGIIKKCDDGIRKHIIEAKELKLRGAHNYQNVCAALAATEDLVDTDKAIEIIKDFTGVEHRIELVRELDGVKWYNDSASSSPTRTISGLNAFDEPIVLIAGGYDKNLDYTPIAKPILDKVKILVLFGKTAPKIYSSVKKQCEIENKKIDIYMCNDLKETIDTAKKYAVSGDVVLFSPASASFDMFKNFMDRGEKFKEAVKLI